MMSSVEKQRQRKIKLTFATMLKENAKKHSLTRKNTKVAAKKRKVGIAEVIDVQMTAQEDPPSTSRQTRS